MRSIEEQVILVTGATDGIGKITARKLAEMGRPCSSMDAAGTNVNRRCCRSVKVRETKN